MREAEAQAGKSGAQRIAIEEQVNKAIHGAAAEPEPRVPAEAAIWMQRPLTAAVAPVKLIALMLLLTMMP